MFRGHPTCQILFKIGISGWVGQIRNIKAKMLSASGP